MTGVGMEIGEVAEKLSISRAWAIQLLAREFALPGPETETIKAVERRKLNLRETRANQMYLSNLVSEERVVNGETVRVQVAPPAVLGQYDAAMARILEARCKLDPIATPIRHIIEAELSSKLSALRDKIPEEWLEVVLAEFSEGGGSEGTPQPPRPEGGQSTH